MPWGTRVVIPVACQKRVLQELHPSHSGIVKMKSITPIHAWWPQMNKQIDELVQNCSACQQVLHWLCYISGPGQLYSPWQRVHIDFADPFLKVCLC